MEPGAPVQATGCFLFQSKACRGWPVSLHSQSPSIVQTLHCEQSSPLAPASCPALRPRNCVSPSWALGRRLANAPQGCRGRGDPGPGC